MRKNIIINTEELQYYLKELKRIPVISHERQDEIFKLFREGNIDEEEKRLLKQEMVVGNLRFVITQAKLYQNQGLDLLDLISEGNIGLLKAIDRFDHKSGVKFISYGVWWIKQSIMSALNEYARTIRIPSNLVQESQKRKRSGLSNGEDEPNTKMKDQIENLPYCVSLHDEIDDEGNQLIDLIRDPNEQNPENVFNSSDEIKKKVAKILSVLDERERIIIEKYFGLNGIESNLEDLGEEFNCTKERIRQLKDKSIKKLRNESYGLWKLL